MGASVLTRSWMLGCDGRNVGYVGQFRPILVRRTESEEERKRTMAGNRNPFLGKWRIVASEVWTREDLDMVVPAHITFRRDRLGELEFIAIGASVDYRIGQRDGAPIVEFTWEGTDEGQPISGRGWARLTGDHLAGHLFIHQGDETGFMVKRDRLLTSRSSGRASRAAHRER